MHLECNVLLLAYIFKNFRSNNFKNYGLCPSHYLSTASFSSDTILKMSKIKLELITDPDMWIFFKKGIRGWISYISNRYIKANNKYLKSYDPKQESKHIKYLDAINLYGYEMFKFLPTSGFQWIDPKEFTMNKYTNNTSKECILQVHLEYPKELHELHNHYSLAPDKIEIKRKINGKLEK